MEWEGERRDPPASVLGQLEAMRGRGQGEVLGGLVSGRMERGKVFCRR